MPNCCSPAPTPRKQQNFPWVGVPTVGPDNEFGTPNPKSFKCGPPRNNVPSQGIGVGQQVDPLGGNNKTKEKKNSTK